MRKTEIAIQDLTLEKPVTGVHPQATLIIELEDQGQDCTEFQVDADGRVVQAGPYQNNLWRGAYINLDMMKLNDLIPIHHPPHIKYGFLKYTVVSVKST